MLKASSRVAHVPELFLSVITMVLSKLGIVLDLISLTGCEINSNSRMKMMWTKEKQILNEDIFTTVLIAI